MERRGTIRYPLRFVVTFSWKDEVDVVHGNEGQSRDISGRGIYVHSGAIPPVGAPVKINILLPRLEPFKCPAELYAEGRVVRIDPGASLSSTAGFAAMNHMVTLRDAEGHTIDDQDSWKQFGRGGSKDE
jgi:hypothetical protein